MRVFFLFLKTSEKQTMCYQFKHTTEKRISYCNHLKQAWIISGRMILGGLACFIHGILPDIFVTTASNIAMDIILKTESVVETPEFANDRALERDAI